LPGDVVRLVGNSLYSYMEGVRVRGVSLLGGVRGSCRILKWQAYRHLCTINPEWQAYRHLCTINPEC